MINQFGTVQQIRSKYPTPLGATHPFFLIEVAQATDAKLLQKDGGTHVTLPTGMNVSQDILMFGDQGVDILSDGEGTATPNWQEKGAIPGSYIDVRGMTLPSQPAPAPEPPPQNQPQPPAPPPTPIDFTALLAKLDEVKAAIEASDAHNVAKLDEMKVAIIKSAGELKDAAAVILPLLTGGSGLFGGLFKKK